MRKNVYSICLIIIIKSKYGTSRCRIKQYQALMLLKAVPPASLTIFGMCQHAHLQHLSKSKQSINDSTIMILSSAQYSACIKLKHAIFGTFYLLIARNRAITIT